MPLTPHPQMKRLGRVLLMLAEPLVLLVMVLAFWHHSPPIRDNWVWLLWLALPIFWLRLFAHDRFWTGTPLNGLLVAFVLLSAYNFANAPFQRGDYVVLMSRPLLGIWLYLYCADHARLYRTMRWLVVAMVGVALVLAGVALTATDWLPAKAPLLAPFMSAMPVIAYREFVPDMLLGFNPNEIAGALAWMTPFLYALLLGLRGRAGATGEPETLDAGWRLIRWVAGAVFVALFIALFLGQSRSAIVGVLLAMLMVSALLIQETRGRVLAFSFIGVVLLLQVAFVLNIGVSSENGAGLNNRDQESATLRFSIWERALRMVVDEPLTGVGMSMYRSAVTTDAYFIPLYRENNRILPHAHNELLQMGADLGVGGWLLYILWHMIAFWMVWYGWCNGRLIPRVVALACFAALVAHGVYGMGDAVTLWDRYSFIFWCVLGMVAAQFTITQQESSPLPDENHNASA